MAIEAHRDCVDSDGKNLALENVGQLDNLAAIIARGPHCSQQQFALDTASRIEFADLDDLDQLEQLLHDLLKRRGLDVDDHRDAAERIVLRWRNGQREDVVTTASEQPRHPSENARTVLNQHAEDVVVGLTCR
ncbi:unannotated protein [freshwater metagenome]|uniref:Unannotated protein n=1 Tax=freshwater metagenome TaxID=449393 RepID=A0A6J6PYF9_9ZZZZ